MSTPLDRNPNTFLPTSRKLPEWLKACVREDGSYDEDLATQLAIAEFHDIDHRGIHRTQHYATEVLHKFNIRHLKLQAKFTGPYRVVKMADRADFVDLYDLIENRHEMEHRSVLSSQSVVRTTRKHANTLRTT